MVADQRILRGVAATLSWQPVDSDGEAAAPSGTVTVQVTSAGGTEVKPEGTATAGSGSDPRTVSLTPAETAELDRLTVVWTDDGDDSAATTVVEIVGGFYFTLAEARASDPALANDTKFSTPALLAARAAVEEEFESICGVAFVPRFEREIVDAGFTLNLRWPQVRSVRGVADWDGTAFVSWTDLEYLRSGVDSIIGGPFVHGVRYQVDYEHGYDRPPAEIKAAALVRLRDRASVPLRGIPDRATSFSVAEGGTYRLDQASLSRTGIPDVDAALARNDHRSRVQ